MEDDQRKSEARRRRLLRKDALKKKRESDHEGKQPHKWSDEEEEENEEDRGSDFDEEEDEEGMEASDHEENEEAVEGKGDFSLEKGKKPCSEWVNGGEKKNIEGGKAVEARRMRLQRKKALKRKRGTLSLAGRRLPSRMSSIDEEETDQGETIPTERTSTGGEEQKLAARLKSEVGVVLGGIKDINGESGSVMSEEDEENGGGGGGGGEGNDKGQSIST